MKENLQRLCASVAIALFVITCLTGEAPSAHVVYGASAGALLYGAVFETVVWLREVRARRVKRRTP